MHGNDLFCISRIQEYIVKFKELFFHGLNLTWVLVRLCAGGVLWCHAELVKVLSKAWNCHNRQRDGNQAPRASPASLREREHGVVLVPDQYLRRRCDRF
jgi:hypothetical protein